MRATFFGTEASTREVSQAAGRDFGEFRELDVDIRDAEGVTRVFSEIPGGPDLVIHTAAQPSHDWAARDPLIDFGVNAIGTLNLLEAAGHTAPTRPSSSVRPTRSTGTSRTPAPAWNWTRLELPEDHPFFDGIDTTMSIDQSTHSLFGVSKASRRPHGPGIRPLLRHADRLLPWRVPDRSPARRGRASRIPGLPDEVRGHRHALHRLRLRRKTGSGQHPLRRPGHAFVEFKRHPRSAAVYNIGGGRSSNCSMLEAIEMCERIAGRELDWTLSPENRIGDHRWWISDLNAFETRLPRLAAAIRNRRDPGEIHASHRVDLAGRVPRRPVTPVCLVSRSRTGPSPPKLTAQGYSTLPAGNSMPAVDFGSTAPIRIPGGAPSRARLTASSVSPRFSTVQVPGGRLRLPAAGVVFLQLGSVKTAGVPLSAMPLELISEESAVVLKGGS